MYSKNTENVALEKRQDCFYTDISSKALSFYRSDSDIFLVAFGGIKGSLGFPVFEFFKSTENINSNKIYIRDIYQAWYQRGLPDIGDDAGAISTRLLHMFRAFNCKKTIMIGNSMGGYAALLFGYLCGADIVHAFSPQTNVEREFMNTIGDCRWKEQLEAIYKIEKAKKYLNLAAVIKSPGKTCFNIYVDTTNLQDVMHAKQLAGVAAIQYFKEGGHQLIKALRNNGQLESLLQNSISAMSPA